MLSMEKVPRSHTLGQKETRQGSAKAKAIVENNQVHSSIQFMGQQAASLSTPQLVMPKLSAAQ